jgi:hypothetical protein
VLTGLGNVDKPGNLVRRGLVKYARAFA